MEMHEWDLTLDKDVLQKGVQPKNYDTSEGTGLPCGAVPVAPIGLRGRRSSESTREIAKRGCAMTIVGSPCFCAERHLNAAVVPVGRYSSNLRGRRPDSGTNRVTFGFKIPPITG